VSFRASYHRRGFIVQGQIVNSPTTQPCDDDVMDSDGLLGNLPVVGNLPGLGGVPRRT
jgi:hypothetical protein